MSDNTALGRRVHRIDISLRLGLRRHRPLYRPLRYWRCMVRIAEGNSWIARRIRAETTTTGESSLPELRSLVVV
jgi:hypothetical protein